MTAAQLIAKLSTYPPDARVVIDVYTESPPDEPGDDPFIDLSHTATEYDFHRWADDDGPGDVGISLRYQGR